MNIIDDRRDDKTTTYSINMNVGVYYTLGEMNKLFILK